LASSSQLHKVYPLIQTNFVETLKVLNGRLDDVDIDTETMKTKESLISNKSSKEIKISETSSSALSWIGTFSIHSPTQHTMEVGSEPENVGQREKPTPSNHSNSPPSNIGAGLSSIKRVEASASSMDIQDTTTPLTSNPLQLPTLSSRSVPILPLSSLKRSGESHPSSRNENEDSFDDKGNPLPAKVRQSQVKQQRGFNGQRNLVGVLSTDTVGVDAIVHNLEQIMWQTLKAASRAAIELKSITETNGFDSETTLKAVSNFTHTLLLPTLKTVTEFFRSRNSSLWRTPLKLPPSRRSLQTSLSESHQQFHSPAMTTPDKPVVIDLLSDEDGDVSSMSLPLVHFVSQSHDVKKMDTIIPYLERETAIRNSLSQLSPEAVGMKESDVSLLASCLFPFEVKRDTLLQCCLGGRLGIAGMVGKDYVTWTSLQSLIDGEKT